MLIGHEVEHVRQYGAWGSINAFQKDYAKQILKNLKSMSPSAAYENVPVEIAAREVGALIEADLNQRLNSGQGLPCP